MQVLVERFGKPGVGREFAGGIIARPRKGVCDANPYMERLNKFYQ